VKPIRFHPDVSEDIEGSFHWYEREQEGLGLQFVDEIEKSLDILSLSPGTWAFFKHGFRRYILPRFPFSIVYKEEETVIYVVAVMHNSRKPNYWMDRIEE